MVLQQQTRQLKISPILGDDDVHLIAIAGQRQSAIDHVMDSFQLSMAPAHSYAEPLRLVTRCKPLDFASYLPISWKQPPNQHDGTGPVRLAFMRELRGAKSGVFSIFVADKDTFPKREDFLREATSTWAPLGFDPQAIASEPASKLGNALTVGGIHTFTSRNSTFPIAYAIELIVADFDSLWFYAEVLGPSAEQNYEAWAVNHRALDLFIQHFRQS